MDTDPADQNPHNAELRTDPQSASCIGKINGQTEKLTKNAELVVN